MIAVPLQHGGEAVGVLKVYSSAPDAFGPEEVETLQLLTESISAQMAHASLFELKEKESRTDALTGLLNRRAYEERLAIEAARSARYGHPLALGLFDLDGFKGVNDRLGHPAGDLVLKGVAEAIDSSRLTDDAFRIGGDEFALLMPETKLEGAQDRGDAGGRRDRGGAARRRDVTACFGVASLSSGDGLASTTRPIARSWQRSAARRPEAGPAQVRSLNKLRRIDFQVRKDDLHETRFAESRGARARRRPGAARRRQPSASPPTTSPTR